MKRTTTLLFTIASFASVLFGAAAGAQTPTIPNAGFENWSNAGGAEIPTGWSTSEQWGMGCAPVTAAKTTDKSDGTYALKLETSFCSGIGAAHEGSASTNMAISTRPDSLKFKYKATFSGPDTARISVDLMNGITKVGYGVFNIRSTQGTYKQVSIPISKISNTAPNAAYITIASDGFYTPTIGNKLWVDDLKFVMKSTTAVATLPDIMTELTCYPDPVTGPLNLAFTLAQASELSIQLYDLRGVLQSESNAYFPAGVHTQVIDMGTLPQGIYLCSIQSPGRGKVVRRIIK